MALENLIVAIIIILIGIALGTLAGKFTKKVVVGFELHRYFKFPIDVVASRVVAYLVYVVAIIIALIKLGISSILLYILLGLIFLIISLFIFLSLKDLIPNLVAGTVLHRRNLKEGDFIRLGNIHGRILEITATETKIKADGETIFIPNYLLFREILYLKKAEGK
ncbi:MAG: mechanosensitive ion channel domain-containing protein [Nanoarchaeota archaeon]